MQITVDGSETGAELFHLSILFQSLAKAHGFVAPVESQRTTVTQTQTVGEVSMTLDINTDDAAVALAAVAASSVEHAAVVVPPPVTDVAQAEINSDVESERQATDFTHVANTNLDADGLPWDARIHSGSRALNVDGTWRTARRPKAMNEDEWQATLTRVKAELRDLMDIPVSTGAVADAEAEIKSLADELRDSVTSALTTNPGENPESIIQATLTSSPIIAPPVNIVPPPVAETVNTETGEITAIVPPPVTVAKPAIETFPQVMVWLTSHTPKDETAKQAFVADVNAILSGAGLTVLTQLGQRPDLIPQVMTQFIEKFGE